MNHTTRRNHFKAIATFGAVILTVPIGVLWAWNVTLPEIFSVPTIDYSNALGLVVLGLAVTIPFARGRGRRNHRPHGEAR